LFISTVSASAGWFEGVLEDAGKNLGRRAVNESGNAAYDGAKSGAKDSVKGSNQKQTNRNDDGYPGDSPRSNTKKKSSAEKSDRAQVGDSEQSEATGDGAAPEVYGNDFDFIPGEQLLVFDDFADTEVGDYPARWTLKDGGGGPAEVVEVDGKRWFHQRKSESKASYAQKTHYTWLRYQVKGDLPAKFTVEMDVLAGDKAWYILRYNGSDVITFGPDRFTTANQTVEWQPVWMKRQVQHISIAVNGTSIKAYVGGKRYLNDPDAITRPIKRLGLAMGSSGSYQYDGIMFTNFRLAEGGKDITKAINTDGRIVTHGITFNTGSEMIRPESGPTLRKILKLLQDNEDLRFEIQGHTDNQGSRKVNQPLSEKRAAAVREWLVKKGIAADRLQSKGMGDTKPMDSNDTQEGRANNRRVEFVKTS
jgi:outer membrane protein OmpA-like peptidoglycan-associated protein